jgi:hypothetical protein
VTATPLKEMFVRGDILIGCVLNVKGPTMGISIDPAVIVTHTPLYSLTHAKPTMAVGTSVLGFVSAREDHGCMIKLILPSFGMAICPTVIPTLPHWCTVGRPVCVTITRIKGRVVEVDATSTTSSSLGLYCATPAAQLEYGGVCVFPGQMVYVCEPVEK